MLIERVSVKKYRSLLDETLVLDNLTALVGANGSGKSTFLKALELFYAASQSIRQDDYYNKETSEPIIITVTYGGLSDEAVKLFSPYLQDDRLAIELVIDWNDGRPSFKYHGSSLRNPDFESVRKASPAAQKREVYMELRATEQYRNFPVWKSQAIAMETLDNWESEHLEQRTRMRDDGQFFGFKGVGKGHLGKFSQFLFIPAVYDAGGDSADGKNSTFSQLMDLVVRSVLASKSDYIELKNKTEEKYREIMDPVKLTELQVLEGKMTETMKVLVPSASIGLKWLPPPDIEMHMPQADIKLIEDGFESSVEKTGHGLQRAFILTLLQHLAIEQAKAVKSSENRDDSGLPTLVLAIEEPEIYQHPNRQRHLAKILMQLAHGKMPGVAENTQVVYCTHSPHFVGIDRINQIRLFRKEENGSGKPKTTKVISTNLDDIASDLWTTEGERGQRYTAETLLPRLHAVMTPWMNEGFFSDVNVLVEGEDDRAAILGVSRAMGHELEGDGFSIIPCGGKNNMDRPYLIFKRLGIPTYVVWDSDYGKRDASEVCECCKKPNGKANPEENKKLLRLFGRAEEEWPTCVESDFACFKDKLECTMREEIGGAAFDEYLRECQDRYGVSKRQHAIKNPNIITDVVEKAMEDGKRSETLEGIVNKILNLKKEAIAK